MNTGPEVYVLNWGLILKLLLKRIVLLGFLEVDDMSNIHKTRPIA